LSFIHKEYLGFFNSEMDRLASGAGQHCPLEDLCVLWANRLANWWDALET
jgi:hypothetical protein